MAICAACNFDNRSAARYCFNCGAKLADPPISSDQALLAATLAAPVASATIVAPADGDTGPLAAPEEATQEEFMETTQPETPDRFAGRYVLSDDQPGRLIATDTEPWHRCWGCGSTANVAGESFCSDCGAALEQRSYRAFLSTGEPTEGLALIAALKDEALRKMLPEIWDSISADGKTLVLLAENNRAPLVPPLADLAALQVGADLIGLLKGLHAQSIALGRLNPSDLTVDVANHPQLRDAPNLHSFTAEQQAEQVQADLQSFAALMEALTDTPRTTRRLDDEEAEEAVDGLPSVLSQIRTGSISKVEEVAVRLDGLLAERTRPTALRHVVGASTHVGMVRDHNEDSYLYLALELDNNDERRTIGCYIVSDGMGGHAAGEVASQMAIRGAADLVLNEYFARSLGDAAYSEEYARDVVRRAGLQANEYVLREGRSRGNDMGATLTMALVVGDRVTVGNVGDSRTYLYRDGKLSRISKDHSLVMRLVELGQIRDEDIYTHPQRSAVLRSLGDKAEIEVDVFSERVRPGEAIFLCSDGQWEMTRDSAIERIIVNTNDPTAACDELVAAANKAGGEDNITALLVRFVA